MNGINRHICLKSLNDFKLAEIREDERLRSGIATVMEIGYLRLVKHFFG